MLGCTLLLGSPLTAFPFLIPGEPGVAGAGSLSLPVLIPDDPALLGFRMNAQVVIGDAGAVAGVATTNAVEIFVGF